MDNPLTEISIAWEHELQMHTDHIVTRLTFPSENTGRGKLFGGKRTLLRAEAFPMARTELPPTCYVCTIYASCETGVHCDQVDSIQDVGARYGSSDGEGKRWWDGMTEVTRRMMN